MWTGESKSFFFNPSVKLSVWERPKELVGNAEVDKLLANPPHVQKTDDKSKPDTNIDAKKIKGVRTLLHYIVHRNLHYISVLVL